MSTIDQTAALVTAEQLLRISSELSAEGLRCELIEGEVIEMSPPGYSHGVVAQELAYLLLQHVKANKLGQIPTAETGFLLSRNPDTVLAPDVAFVSNEQLERRVVPEKYFPEAPTVAMEVVSPGDTVAEVDEKSRRWLKAGSKQAWVVHPKGRTVTIYYSLDEIRIFTGNETLSGGDAIVGFDCRVADLFSCLS